MHIYKVCNLVNFDKCMNLGNKEDKIVNTDFTHQVSLPFCKPSLPPFNLLNAMFLGKETGIDGCALRTVSNSHNFKCNFDI